MFIANGIHVMYSFVMIANIRTRGTGERGSSATTSARYSNIIYLYLPTFVNLQLNDNIWGVDSKVPSKLTEYYYIGERAVVKV